MNDDAKAFAALEIELKVIHLRLRFAVQNFALNSIPNCGQFTWNLEQAELACESIREFLIHNSR